MKRSGLTLLLAAFGLALLAYAGGFLVSTAQHRAMLRSHAPALAWLKAEFHLTDAEFDRISELHDAYLPACAERCQRIDAINGELKTLLANSSTLTPEIERKLADAAALRLECEKAMLKHFLAVSQAMPPEQGKRYLEWIEQRTFMPEHRMAQPSRAEHHHH